MLLLLAAEAELLSPRSAAAGTTPTGKPNCFRALLGSSQGLRSTLLYDFIHIRSTTSSTRM
ncbi:unnamed protein product [Linum tenue]|uniref:Uncharacterized protein n=1 Tax=Linum tenue TaxID=586396 RepID=A0AAV0KU90_9ROSI|nr:unnamed protein product [Linum tenue]